MIRVDEEYYKKVNKIIKKWGGLKDFDNFVFNCELLIDDEDYIDSEELSKINECIEHHIQPEIYDLPDFTGKEEMLEYLYVIRQKIIYKIEYLI